MRTRPARTALTAALCLALAACGVIPVRPAADAPTEAVIATLSQEARGALTEAEAQVKAATAAFTLWTAADQALRRAQEAALKGDSDTVIREAGKVAHFTRLGAAQADYPSTEMK